MSLFQSHSLSEFKDFINRNTFVVAVTAFNGNYTSQQLLYELNSILMSFQKVKCAKIEMENMHDFASEYGIGMPCIVYFVNGQKVHQNDSTDRNAIKRDLENYCEI